MKKIKTEIYKSGHINCLEDHCIFRKECANHDSAGDFRLEDGMSPRLKLIDEQLYCLDIDSKTNDSIYSPRPIDNEDSYGSISIENVEIIRNDHYVI